MKLFLNLIILIICSISFAKQKLIITGSSTIAPVLSDLAKKFEIQNKKYRLDVQTGGSSRGILDARKKLSDIGMVSRSLKANEADLSALTIAKDGLSVIINSSNPVRELTRQQIVDIYQRKIQNWKQLGGEDTRIILVHKAEGRSTLELFLKFFKLDNKKVKPHVIIGDNEQGVKIVTSNTAAIAYVSVGAAEYNIEQKLQLKALPIDGVAATRKNVRNATYPLIRDLNLVYLGGEQKKSQLFFDFLRTSSARKIIEEHYLVPAL